MIPSENMSTIGDIYLVFGFKIYGAMYPGVPQWE